LLSTLANSCSILFFYLFPSGQFVPRWTRWLAVAGLAVGVADAFFPAWDVIRNQMVALAWFIPGIAAQVYRYRRVSTPAQRQQTKWAVFGVSASLVGQYLLIYLIEERFRGIIPIGSWPFMVYGVVLYGVILFLPLSIFIAILRDHLFDIDHIINRTLGYGTLTAMLAAVYFGGVALLQQGVGLVTGQRSSQLAIVASTLAIAALFQPLRRRLQAVIDRRFYRRKYDARRTLADFGGRLRDETDLDRLSADLVATVEEALRPAHVSLWLRPGNRHR
jgi:hypothetical protein